MPLISSWMFVSYVRSSYCVVVALLLLVSFQQTATATTTTTSGSRINHVRFARELAVSPRNPWFPTTNAKTTTQRRRRRRVFETKRQQQKIQFVSTRVQTKKSGLPKQQPTTTAATTTTTTTNKSGDNDTVVAVAPSPPKSKTLLSAMTTSFQNQLMIQGGRDIHTPRLLQACKVLEQTMRRVGQRANAHELASNIHKVEAVYKIAPSPERDSVIGLLHYEKYVLQIHKPNGLLKDPSAAIGLLWLRRSLEFQSALYSLILAGNSDDNHHDSAFATRASMQAYQQTLERNHGWKIRRIYTLGLRTGTPTRHELLSSLGGFKTMGPEEENIMQRDMKILLHTWKPVRSYDNITNTTESIMPLHHPGVTSGCRNDKKYCQIIVVSHS